MVAIPYFRNGRASTTYLHYVGIAHPFSFSVGISKEQSPSLYNKRVFATESIHSRFFNNKKREYDRKGFQR